MADLERERWTKLVADYETSELTQLECASERGISFSNLRNWLYRLRKETRPLVEEPAKESRQALEQRPAKKDSRLLAVRMAASAAKPRPEEPATSEPEKLLELALPSGTRVRFPADTDLKYLRDLAAAL